LTVERTDLKADNQSLTTLIDHRDKKILTLKEEKFINCKEIQFLRNENKQLTLKCSSFQNHVEDIENQLMMQRRSSSENKDTIKDITHSFQNKIEKLNLNKFFNSSNKSPKTKKTATKSLSKTKGKENLSKGKNMGFKFEKKDKKIVNEMKRESLHKFCR